MTSTDTKPIQASTLRLYIQMSRPKVMALVLITGLPALVIGQEVTPSFGFALVVLLGTAMAGSACSVLNAYYERDIDARMARTQNRPLPAAALVPIHAAFFGVVLAVASTGILYLCGGMLPALVGIISILFYVFVYTVGLKRRTPQNIVIGGAAGAVAPLIADAAVDGVLGPVGWILFLIIFLWTPPHFWAIALFRKEEYRAAELPMMPLVVGDRGTRFRSLGYTMTLLPATLALVFYGFLGMPYLVVATALWCWFLVWNIRAITAEDYAVDRKMFMSSNIYLLAVFAMMLIDAGIATANSSVSSVTANESSIEISPFSFRDQTGEAFSSDSLVDTPWVAGFMFTRCNSICPPLTEAMAKLHDTASLASLQFVSISTDPSYDSPEQLTTYMAEHGIEEGRWNFLTGEREQIQAISAEFMLALELPDGENTSIDEILHSSYLVLLGEGLSIIGHYDSSDTAAMDRLVSDAEAYSAQ